MNPNPILTIEALRILRQLGGMAEPLVYMAGFGVMWAVYGLSSVLWHFLRPSGVAPR